MRKQANVGSRPRMNKDNVRKGGRWEEIDQEATMFRIINVPELNGGFAMASENRFFLEKAARLLVCISICNKRTVREKKRTKGSKDAITDSGVCVYITGCEYGV